MARARLRTKLLALGVSCAVCVLLAEACLRIYNPVPLPLRGKRIVLPVNQRKVLRYPPEMKKLGPVVTRVTNRLGFRGAQPPDDFAAHVTVVTVGGSTTECLHQNEGKTWPDQLAQRLAPRIEGLWLNNAGLDGHSTFGHNVLLDQMLLELQPDVILFLVGVNDVSLDVGSSFDASISLEQATWKQRLADVSELLATGQVLYRSLRALDLGLTHNFELDLTELKPLPLPSASDVEAAIAEHQKTFLPAFRSRLMRLLASTRAAGIQPVLLTQPALFGAGIDPTTGVEIAPLPVAGAWVIDERYEPALLKHRILEAYNDVVRDVGRREGVLVIDLAASLPRDSKLYYDWIHYTDDGSAAVADLIDAQLGPWLEAHADELRAR